MKPYTMFSYDLLFGDYFSNCSNQAKLYYIKLNFYANKGFVASPMGVLDSLGYDRSVFYELVKAGEILTLPDRAEIFITSYYVHNHHFRTDEWTRSPFAIYWMGKLYIKPNGVAKFDENGLKKKEPRPEMLENIVPPPPPPKTDDETWEQLLKELDEEGKEDK